MNLKKRDYSDPAASSNMFFLVPFIISFIHSYFYYSIIIALVILSSVTYHRSKESNYRLLDILFSALLISTNFYIFYLNSFYSINFLFAILFVGLGFIFYQRAHRNNFSFNHAIWHLSSSVITTLAIVTAIK